MSTQNQSPLQQQPSPIPQSNYSDTSYDYSAQFSPSPPSSQQLRNSPDSDSQAHPHLEHDEQSAVPLLHHETGLPVTVFVDPSMASPPVSHPFLDNQLDNQPHPDLIPVIKSSNADHRHQQSPSSIVRKARLPELPLHLLPQAEDEFDTDRLEQVVERLQDANKSMLTSAGAQHHAENLKSSAVGTGVGEASPYEMETVRNGGPSHEDQDRAGPSHMVPREETINQEQNYEDGISAKENDRQTMEEVNGQMCSGYTDGGQNPTNENYPLRETVKEEPAFIQEEGAYQHDQSGLTEQQNGTGAYEQVIAEPSGVVDEDGSPHDPSPAQDQSDESSASSDRDQPRRTGRKRSRSEFEIGYWLRSRKPPSSSKRSRRTYYWLRP